jgi:hypothetical protein
MALNTITLTPERKKKLPLKKVLIYLKVVLNKNIKMEA